MRAVKPFGDHFTARILVVGHDPRLQYSGAEAEHAFFFNYLRSPRLSSGPEAAKYDLAAAVWDYISWLADSRVPLEEVYVTNFCNEFLDHIPGSGTVLFPDDVARRGVKHINQIVADGHFQVILPMAVQPFYHLCRLGFIDEHNERTRHFIEAAKPNESKGQQGIYVQSGRAPFLLVCGQEFYHHGIPVIPILHVKQWTSKNKSPKYTEPMQKARQQVRAALNALQGG